MRALRTLVVALTLCLAGGAATAGASVIAAGEAASCSAIGGVAVCWGSDSSGTRGDGDAVTGDSYDPVQPVGLGSGVTAISMTGEGGGSGSHTCAVVAGAAKCWGPTYHGNLGDGTDTARSVPTQVVGLESGVTQIDVHTSRSCAIQSGTAKCWGGISKQFSGAPTGADLLVPHDVAGGAGAIAVSPGWRHECIVIADGSVRCYGDNTNDQLGGGTPVLPGPVTDLTAGADHNCVLIGDGARCWGNGTELGYGSTDNSATPVTPVGMGSGVTAIDANWNHVCAIKGGKAYCWGDAMNGKLGDGRELSASMPPQLTPVEVVGLTNVTDIAVGRNHTCAVVGGTERWCWGRNEHGQLGNEAAGPQSSVPVPVIGSSPKPPVVVTPPVVVPKPAPKPPVVIGTPRPVAPSILFSSSARKVGSTRVVTVATLVCPAGAASCKVTLPRTVTLTIDRKSYTLSVTAPRSVRAGRRAGVTVKLSRGAATRLRGKVATVTLTIALGTTRKTVKQKITAPAPPRRHRR